MLSPSFLRLIENFTKFFDKNWHRLRVVVGLRCWVVYVSFGTNSNSEWYSWIHCLFWKWTCWIFVSPYFSTKVCHIEPSFIYIEKCLIFQLWLKELPCPFLSKKNVPCRVGVHCLIFDVHIAHIHVFLEHIIHCIQFYVFILSLFD